MYLGDILAALSGAMDGAHCLGAVDNLEADQLSNDPCSSPASIVSAVAQIPLL